MKTTNTPAASTPDLTTYLRVHRLLRASATEFAATLRSAAATAAAETAATKSAPSPGATRRDRAMIRWYRGFSGEIRCHHHIEDELLFPALKDRVATYGEFGPRLDGDHASLDVVLDGLTAALDAGDRAKAAELAEELRDHLDEHLAFEDDEIVPLFVRHFTAIEFEELDSQAIKMTPPKQMMFTLPWFAAQLATAEREEVLAAAPKALTVMWMLTRGRYARLTARAFSRA